MTNISTRDIKLKYLGGDAGDIYVVTCPECKEEVNVAEHAWWNPVCRCGYHWTVDVLGVAWKEDI